MIIKTILENGLIRRQSDRGVYIRNEQTGYEYAPYADDIPNRVRKKLGLEEYTYTETEKPIKKEVIYE